jgi:hypothetical protein
MCPPDFTGDLQIEGSRLEWILTGDVDRGVSMFDEPAPQPLDWVAQLQAGTLSNDVDPLTELQRLAEDLDPADSLAVFANVDVPEIDLANE